MTAPGAPSTETGRAGARPVEQLTSPDRIKRATTVVGGEALHKVHQIGGRQEAANRINAEWTEQRQQDTVWAERNNQLDAQLQSQNITGAAAEQRREAEFKQQVVDWAAHISGSGTDNIASANIWTADQQSGRTVEQAIQDDPILRRLGFTPNHDVPGTPNPTIQQRLEHWLANDFYDAYCTDADHGTDALVARLTEGVGLGPNGEEADITQLRADIAGSNFLRQIYGGTEDILHQSLRLATEYHLADQVYELHQRENLPTLAQQPDHRLTDRRNRQPNPGINEPAVIDMLDRRAPQPPAPEPPRREIAPPQQIVIEQIHAAQQALQGQQEFRGVNFDTAATDPNDPRHAHYFDHPAQRVDLTAQQRDQLLPDDNPGEQSNVIEEAVMYGGTTEASRAQALLAADRIVLDAFGTTQQEQETEFGEMMNRLDTWIEEIDLGPGQQQDQREVTASQNLLLAQIRILRREQHAGAFATEDELRAALQDPNRAVVLRIADPQEAPEVLRAHHDDATNTDLPSLENLVQVQVAGQPVFLEIDRDATIQRWVEAHARIGAGLEQGQITQADQENFIEQWAAGIDHEVVWDILQHAVPTPEPIPHPTGESLTPSPTLVQAINARVEEFHAAIPDEDLSQEPEDGTPRAEYFRAGELTQLVDAPTHPEALLLPAGQALRIPGDQPTSSWTLNPEVAQYIHTLGEEYGNDYEILEHIYDNLGSSLAVAAAVYGGTTETSRARYLLNAYNLVLEAYGHTPATREQAFRTMLESQQRQIVPTIINGQVIGQESVLISVYLRNEVAALGNQQLSADELRHPAPDSDRNFGIIVRPLAQGEQLDPSRQLQITGTNNVIEIDIDATVALWQSRYDQIQARIRLGEITPADARQITIWSDGVRQDEIVDYLATAPLPTPAAPSRANESFAPTGATAESHLEIPGQGINMATAIDIREHHDDRVFTRPLANGAIFIAADGMTNPPGGGQAADIIITQFSQRFPQDLQITTIQQAQDLAQQAWREAQTALDASQQIVDGAGAAISIGIIVTINKQQHLITVQGGDTTMFRMRNGQLDVLAPRQSGLRQYYERALGPQAIDFLEGFVDEHQLNAREFQEEAVRTPIPQLTPELARTVRDQMLQLVPQAANFNERNVQYYILDVLRQDRLSPDGTPGSETLLAALQNPSIPDAQLVQLVSECLIRIARAANNLVSQGTLAKGGTPFEPAITVNQVEPGDRFAAVSDGITDNQKRSAIGRILTSAATPSQAATSLRDGVKDSTTGHVRKPDDYTAAVVYTSHTPPWIL